MTEKRVRIGRIQVIVEAFADDGVNLQPLTIDPVVISAAQVGSIAEMLAESVARWEVALNAAPTGEEHDDEHDIR